MKTPAQPRNEEPTLQDDQAEGRSTPSSSLPLRSGDIATVPPTNSIEPIQESGTEGISSAPGLEGEEPEVKKVRLSGAQKKAAAKARQQEQWEAKKLAKEEAKKEAVENGGGGGRVKLKGQNKVCLSLFFECEVELIGRMRERIESKV